MTTKLSRRTLSKNYESHRPIMETTLSARLARVSCVHSWCPHVSFVSIDHRKRKRYSSRAITYDKFHLTAFTSIRFRLFFFYAWIRIKSAPIVHCQRHILYMRRAGYNLIKFDLYVSTCIIHNDYGSMKK